VATNPSRTRRRARAREAPAARDAASRSTVTVDQLVGMSRAQLDALYRRSSPGSIPNGVGDGTVVLAAGQALSSVAARLARVGWQGKVFDPDRHDLLNRVLPTGVRAVRAKVSLGESRLDGKPTIVLDYSRTSLLAHWIRDEIREVAPGLYLGIVYVAGRRTINFALTFGAP
jgi:hypothetical protein